MPTIYIRKVILDKITVLLADDHTLFRAGVRMLLGELTDVEIVGEASDGHETLSLVQTLKPDVIFLDIAMKGLNGIEVASRITHILPSARIIILSMHASEEYVVRALQAGVDGYLLKDSVPGELEFALRAVLRGDKFLSPAVSKSVVGGFLGQHDSNPNRDPSPTLVPLERLTPRQRETLQLIAEGATTKEIAAKLKRSVKTIEAHRAELMNRLDIHDIAGLVRYAIRIGLISSDT
jgi:DNA-binding NarL/FixJ family response regulator